MCKPLLLIFVVRVAWNIENYLFVLSLSKHVGTLVPSNNKISLGFCSDYLLVPQDLRKCSPISVKLIDPGYYNRVINHSIT